MAQSAQSDQQKSDAIVNRFQELMEERDSLSSATIDRQQDLAEHDLVIKTLQPVDSSRKCCRLVGDVLTEQTVEAVLPAVQKNRDNLQGVRYAAAYRSWPSCRHPMPTSAALQVVQQLEARLAEKQKEVLAFQQKYNIRIKVRAGSSWEPCRSGGALSCLACPLLGHRLVVGAAARKRKGPGVIWPGRAGQLGRRGLTPRAGPGRTAGLAGRPSSSVSRGVLHLAFEANPPLCM